MGFSPIAETEFRSDTNSVLAISFPVKNDRSCLAWLHMYLYIIGVWLIWCELEGVGVLMMCCENGLGCCCCCCNTFLSCWVLFFLGCWLVLVDVVFCLFLQCGICFNGNDTFFAAWLQNSAQQLLSTIVLRLELLAQFALWNFEIFSQIATVTH